MRCCIHLHPSLDLRHAGGAIEVNLYQAQRPIHEVNMTIFESGQKQMPAGINNFRQRSTVGLNILVAADRKDFVCFDGQSLRPRLLVI